MGSGYRVFTAGEVLTASNVQNYLQDQAVMVFGGTAARSSAIGTANFEEGMLTYLTDVDKLQVYTGAAFADVYPAAATNQGLTLINTTSFSGVSSQSINDVFSATYDNYRIIIALTDSSVLTNVFFRFRVSGSDNSNASYNYMFDGYTQGGGSVPFTAAGATQLNLYQRTASGTKTTASDLTCILPFATATTLLMGPTTAENNANFYSGSWGGNFDVTTSFTGFSVIGESGTLTGSISVYGINK
jgi:hypothetical protein